VVHTSNFRKVKRIDDVISIFEKLRKILPSKLLLVGDGPDRARIERQCKELDMMSDVRFLGKLDAIEEVLSVADLFLMPSESESFGLAALEALACEVPLITSNAGGLPELNVHGVSGFLSNVGDVDDMVKNAAYILDDAHLPQFKINALARAKEFEVAKIVPHYESYYERVLEANRVVS